MSGTKLQYLLYLFSNLNNYIGLGLDLKDRDHWFGLMASKSNSIKYKIDL